MHINVLFIALLLHIFSNNLQAIPVNQKQMCVIPPGQQLNNVGQNIKIANFSLSPYELTFGEWNAVHNWALKQGYQFGFGKGETEKHPVSTVTWYDAVKFCNAASELAGLTPVYYANENKNQVYRVGELNLSDVCVKVEANGYRLPTEWEWEYACRAGSKTLYYYGETSIPSVENPYAWHTNSNGKGNNVSPHIVGLKKPNLFGLYDMSGNVAEWCWNLYSNYASWRIQRGGSVALDNDVTSGFRSPVPPDYRIFDAGLRLASNSSSCPMLTEIIVSKGLSITINHQMLSPQYDGQNEQAVATKLVSLLSPNSPEVQKVIALNLSGKYKEALEAYRDVFAAHLRTAPAMKFRAPKAPREADKIAAWFTETENFATTAKNQFDNLDNLGRMQENSYHMPVTWDFGMGFNYYSELWFDVIRQLVVALPVAERYGSLPPRAVANMVIYAATDDISKQLKDPRNCVGNQQIEEAKVLVEISRKLPEFKDAGAWDKLGIDRLKNGALTRFILPDGGDLEQSFNYNAGLFRATTSIFEIFEGQSTPDWVEKLKSMSICRTRMFGVLRLSSGTAPSVGNNAYGRDLPAGKEDVIKENDPFFDALVEKINDQLIFKGKKGLSPPIFTSIALPYSGYYLMRNGWTNQSSSLFFKSSRPGAGHNHSDNNSIELCAYGRHLLVDREAPPYNVDHLPVDERKDFPWVLEYKGEEARWTANNLLIDGGGQLPGVNNKGYNSTIPNQSWYTSEDFDFVQGTWTRTFKTGEPLDLKEVRSYAAKYGATLTEASAQLTAATQLNAQQQQSFEATHTRQVIYLRQANAWIVTDWASRNDGQKAKAITQLWHFPSPRLEQNAKKTGGYSKILSPGFEKEQVVCDELEQRILTNNPENVNLAILSAVPGKVQYIRSFGDKYPYRGWANAVASMVSGYVPAVDLQVVYTPEQPIVTVLIPIPQGEKYEQRVKSFSKDFTNGQTRIKLKFIDGTDVEYVVANSLTELTVGKAKANAEGLLLMTRKDAVQGLSMSRFDKNFAFQLLNNKMRITREITVPVGFSWEDTVKGLVPAYGSGSERL